VFVVSDTTASLDKNTWIELSKKEFKGDNVDNRLKAMDHVLGNSLSFSQFQKLLTSGKNGLTKEEVSPTTCALCVNCVYSTFSCADAATDRDVQERIQHQG
jgi:hypothetical protein